MVVDDLSVATLLPIPRENIAKEARVMTDEAGQYRSYMRLKYMIALLFRPHQRGRASSASSAALASSATAGASNTGGGGCRA